MLWSGETASEHTIRAESSVGGDGMNGTLINADVILERVREALAFPAPAPTS